MSGTTSLLSIEDALRLVLAHARRLEPDTIALTTAALGLVLAEDIVSDVDLPPFDKSLMDGFAVRSADVASASATLEIIEEVTAGRMPTKPLGPGQCTRIMTGAPLPVGADAVVMHEKTETVAAHRVLIPESKAGKNLAKRGSDLRNGEVVLREGTLLRPQECGILATVGRTAFKVYRQPVVAILTTGDEIIEPFARPGPAQIRNSNASMLAGQVARAHGRPRYLGIAEDKPEALRPLMLEGLKTDVLLVSGGVSAGKLDLAPGVLQELGVRPIFHKIAMKPGKPLFFGVKDQTLVFGLPGNPVSGFVGFELFVRPALRALLGWKQVRNVELPARLSHDYKSQSDRPLFHPCQLHWTKEGWEAKIVAWQGSADLRGLALGNALIRLTQGEHEYRAGDEVSALAPEIDL